MSEAVDRIQQLHDDLDEVLRLIDAADEMFLEVVSSRRRGDDRLWREADKYSEVRYGPNMED